VVEAVNSLGVSRAIANPINIKQQTVKRIVFRPFQMVFARAMRSISSSLLFVFLLSLLSWDEFKVECSMLQVFLFPIISGLAGLIRKCSLVNVFFTLWFSPDKSGQVVVTFIPVTCNLFHLFLREGL